MEEHDLEETYRIAKEIEKEVEKETKKPYDSCGDCEEPGVCGHRQGVCGDRCCGEDNLRKKEEEEDERIS